jgi:hypothetical protein
MKKIIFLLIAAITASCDHSDKDDEQISTTTLGTWKLIEVLADPGDGSGVYKKVNSDRTITFFTTGKVECNQSLCSIGSGNGQSATGVFDETNGIIAPDACPSHKINVKLEGAYLFLTYMCIEPCGEKYERIANGNTP